MNSKRKNLLSVFIGLLLFVVTFSVAFVRLGGIYSPGGVIALLLFASLVMMIVSVSAWLINHKHLDRKKRLIICIVNSLIIFILVAIWPIIVIIKNKPCSPAESLCATEFSWELLGILSFLAIMYCLINICFWVDLSKTKKLT